MMNGGGEKSTLSGLENCLYLITNERVGYRKLSTFNHVFLGKWLWRFTQKSNYLWRRLVGVKYGESGGYGTSHQIFLLDGLGV